MIKIAPAFSNSIQKFVLKSEKPLASSPCLSDTPSLAKIPAYAHIANATSLNFCGKKIVGKTQIINRETGFLTDVSIKRTKVGNSVSFDLCKGSQRLGFVDTEILEADENPAFEVMPYEKVLNINHLRTIEGEKYSQIGTQLLKIAIQESINSHCLGNICLEAQKGYASIYSSYRQDESPIPFYLKFGLQAFDPAKNFALKKCIENNQIGMLPDTCPMYLSLKKRDEYVRQFRIEPMF